MLIIQLPSYNNFNNLEKKILSINDDLEYDKYEFLIVDHSKKNYQIDLVVLQSKFKLNKIHYYHLKKKSSINERGLASRYGYSKALELHNNISLIEIDSDDAHDTTDLNRLIKKSLDEKLDIVIASKYLKYSKVKNRRFIRKIISRIFNFSNKLIFGLKVSDTTNSYRFYSKKALSNYTRSSLISQTAIGHLQLLIINKLNNANFGEIHSIYRENKNGESNINFKQLIFCLFEYINIIFLYLVGRIK